MPGYDYARASILLALLALAAGIWGFIFTAVWGFLHA